MVDLCTLEPEHRLRNAPLSEIGAEYRPAGAKAWKSVDNYRIAGCTFNQLGPVWLVKTEWRATAPSVDYLQRDASLDDYLDKIEGENERTKREDPA